MYRCRGLDRALDRDSTIEDVASRRRFGCGRLGPAALVVTLLAIAGNACDRRSEPIVVALRSSIETLDPHTHNELMVWSLLSNFYDALVRFSPTMTLEPSLAMSWERVDFRTTRFRLRSGVRFHDGTVFGAEDVVASFRRASGHPRSGIKHYLSGIKDVRAENEYSLIVETETAAPTLLNRLAYLFVVPRGEEGLAEITDPVGTGPYRYAGTRSDGSVVGRAFGGWRERPPIEEVRFIGIDDETERARRFVAGDVDLAVALPDLQTSDIQQSPGRRLMTQPILGVRMVVVVPRAAQGTARKALEDPRVRRAMLAAIDRQRLADRVYQGNATVASQYVPPVVFGYEPELRPVPYDPREARRLLAEAGFAGGFEVVLGHGHIPERLESCLIEDLDRIGVRLRPAAFPFSELVKRVRAEEIPLMLFSRSSLTGDASEFLDSVIHSRDPARGLGGENYHGFSDPIVDGLIESADAELDSGRRLSLLQEAQRRVLDDLPLLPLVIQWEQLGVSDRVEVVTRHDGWLWVAAFRWAGNGDAVR